MLTPALLWGTDLLLFLLKCYLLIKCLSINFYLFIYLEEHQFADPLVCAFTGAPTRAHAKAPLAYQGDAATN